MLIPTLKAHIDVSRLWVLLTVVSAVICVAYTQVTATIFHTVTPIWTLGVHIARCSSHFWGGGGSRNYLSHNPVQYEQGRPVELISS